MRASTSVAALSAALMLSACATSLPSDPGGASEAPAVEVLPPAFRLVSPVQPASDRREPLELLPAERDSLFAQCSACHSLRPGQNGIGPSLAGIYGRRTGSVAGYPYSDDLAAFDFRWDAARLDRWLTDPRAMAGGTKMLYRGIADPLRRAQLIAFLQREARLPD